MVRRMRLARHGARIDGVLREIRLVRALSGTNVPHAALLAADVTDTVLSMPFYVMQAIDGWGTTDGGWLADAMRHPDLQACRGLACQLGEGAAKLGAGWIGAARDASGSGSRSPGVWSSRPIRRAIHAVRSERWRRRGRGPPSCSGPQGATSVPTSWTSEAAGTRSRVAQLGRPSSSGPRAGTTGCARLGSRTRYGPPRSLPRAGRARSGGRREDFTGGGSRPSSKPA